jgi:hypothetical protein
MTRRLSSLIALAAAVMLVLAATAAAAPAPPNDSRDHATTLGSLPASVTGTTAGATVDPIDPPSGCARAGGSVWYQLTTGQSVPRNLAIEVHAHGELDAVVDVFVKERSQNERVTCDPTDKHGQAVFEFGLQPKMTYLIRVAQLSNSASGSFTLQAFVPPPPASAPGTPLAAHGASGSLIPVVHVSAAYSAHLTAGVSYIVNLVSPQSENCIGLAIYGPAAHSFGARPVTQQDCQGERLFTPQQSGLYSLLVRVNDRTAAHQPYHLQLAPATMAQTTPGLPLVNYATVHGRLDGNHVGVIRLYRFDVTARSDLELDLLARQDFNMSLRTAGGKDLRCACNGNRSITTITKPGRYYVEIDADNHAGRFTLRRRSRVITHTALRIDGTRFVERPPHVPVTVSVSVSAGADGPAEVVIDRLDPVFGWQFKRMVRVHVQDGVGSFTFTPPTLGQWSAHASFLGSHGFSPSGSRASRVLSAGPLSQALAGVHW